MNEQEASNVISLDLEALSPTTKEYVLYKANEWECSPADAWVRLMDEIATEQMQGSAA